MSATIAAISTPLGEGGIGVVRISGENARAVADKIFRSVSGKRISEMAGYTAAFGKVYNGDTAVDEAVALVFSAPKSYTGEDVVELSVHGGVFITREVLRAACEQGARLAEPGEFTRRAFENKKMNLLETESVMALIQADGMQSLLMASALKDGSAGKKINSIKDELLRVLAAVAVFSDYPDEDLPEADIGNVKRDLESIKAALEALIRDYDTGRLIRDGIDTAILGAPNVGKSTLMNLLSRSERSIVTSIAGTTRDIVEETVRIGDIKLRLADTAGVHETADAVEAIGVTRAKERAEKAQLILAVFDGSRELEDSDREILSFIKKRKCIVIVNKSDCEQVLDASVFDGFKTVFISAMSGEGKAMLEDAIKEITGTAYLSPSAAVLSSERQRDCAHRALVSTAEALETMAAGYTLDAIGICADEALEALLELTGERVSEAVANEVFSRFCVGK